MGFKWFFIFRAFSANRKYDTLIPWNRKWSYFCHSIIHSLESLKSFYGIDDEFEWDLIYSRSESNNILLYVNPTINRLCLTSQSAKKLKVVNTGLKLFEYNSRTCECAYRICQEGVSVIRKHMTKRIVPVCLEDFKRVLETQKISAEITAFSEATQGILKELEAGACVFELNEEAKKELTAKFPRFQRVFEEMGCVVWRGVKNINVLVTETDIDTMKRVLLMDV
jgi:tRNA (cytosine-5-)-methyltransferase NSUN2